MLSYSVSSRLREIGVRLALGAAPARMVRFVLAEGLRLAAGGVVIGVLAALAAGRLTRSVVIDVNPTDPRILGAVAVVMLAVAALRRSSRAPRQRRRSDGGAAAGVRRLPSGLEARSRWYQRQLVDCSGHY